MRQPSVPARVDGASGNRKELQGSARTDRMAAPPRLLVERLSRAIDEALGPACDEQGRPLREGVEPVFAQAREAVRALAPEPGGKLLSPQAQEGVRAGLARTLDQMEDILEALQLAADGSRGPGGREGRGGR